LGSVLNFFHPTLAAQPRINPDFLVLFCPCRDNWVRRE
jgi:hypothetical protein